MLRKYSPEYFHVLWTDYEIMDFIKEFYPNHFQYYLRLNMNIKRADIARYLIMHKFDGVYFDLDVELKVRMRQLVPPDAGLTFISYKSKEFEKRKDHFAGNAFFACTPVSPIIWAMVRHAMSFSNPAVKDVYGVLRHTGPMGLGLVVQHVVSRPNEYPAQSVRIYNSSAVGNVEDVPWGAVHRRKHKWNP